MTTTTLRAKFHCTSIERSMGGRYRKIQGEDKYVPEPVTTIKMQPVYGADGNEENKEFWDATPSGSLELGCVYPEAVAHIEVGQDYYLDITPAPAG